MKARPEHIIMPEKNARVKQIINHFADGNVSAFVQNLHGISHQVLNRIFNIDRRKGGYPGVSSDIITAIAKGYPSVDTNWILTGEGAMLLEQQKGPALSQAKGIEERIKEIDTRTADIQSSLDTVQDTQNWVAGLVGEILNMLVKKEANGNQEKEKQLLDEIAKKIGPDLPAFLKTGIRADGHKTGMGNS